MFWVYLFEKGNWVISGVVYSGTEFAGNWQVAGGVFKGHYIGKYVSAGAIINPNYDTLVLSYSLIAVLKC